MLLDADIDQNLPRWAELAVHGPAAYCLAHDLPLSDVPALESELRLARDALADLQDAELDAGTTEV